MRFATLAEENGTTAALIDADGSRFVPIPGYADLGALLRDGSSGRDAAAAASAEEMQPLDRARLRRPILEPSAIFCVGLNYRSHILEMNRELPTDPTLFAKFARSLTDPFATIELPLHSDKVDYEGELCVVIGEGGRDIAAADAWGHVAGLTVLNDVTMRDFQKRTIEWLAGKIWQASTPVGPWVVTPDELGEIGSLELSLSVNGEERQRSDLGDLVFDVPALIADISKIVELEPGDLIATGTPGGVGAAEGKFLADGDVVEVAIDGIGKIRNEFSGADRQSGPRP